MLRTILNLEFKFVGRTRLRIMIKILNESAKALEINFLATEADIRNLMILMGINQMTTEQLIR